MPTRNCWHVWPVWLMETLVRERRRVMAATAVVVLVVAGCGTVVGLHVETVVWATGLGMLLVVAVVAGWLGLRHVRLARQLHRASRPTEFLGVSIQAVRGLPPVVAGLLRPRIYACEELLATLPPGQSRAVVLHERSHLDHRDPARLVALEAVRRCLGWIPAIAHLEETARARLEIRADRHALEAGVTRQELAAALMRLSTTGPATMPAFGVVSDQRLLALLGEDRVGGRVSRRWLGVLAVVVATGAVCTSVLPGAHPEFMWVVGCLQTICVPGL